MARTLISTREIGSVQRNDMDITTTGQAVVAKLIAGSNITFSSTGVDAGTGDVTINASGGGGGSTTFTVQTFIATAAQNTFTISGGYTVGLINIFYNGSKLTPSEYTAINTTTVVLSFNAELNDIIDVEIFTTVNVALPKTFGTITYSAAPSWDYTTGYNKKITLTGVATLSITGDSDGDYGTLFVTQDATGGRVLTLPVGDNITGVSPVTTANAITVYSYVKNGSVRYWNASNR